MVDDCRKRIAIIGAGISGLLACKYALSKGFQPTIFEVQSGVGGLWNKTLSTTKLQTPKSIFQFSDFPWPESVTVDFDYLRAYADHFGLMKHIKFHTKVVSINYRGVAEDDMEAWSLWGGNSEAFSSDGGKWEVRVLTGGKLATESEVFEADFVVLCLGKYSDVPNIPEFPHGEGPETFQGRVIHSMECSGMEAEEGKALVKGKRVAVVGFQKQALEIAMWCSEINGKENPCRVLYRTEHWNIPDFQAWSFPLAKLYFNRFAELLIHKPGEGLLLSLLATILSPIRWAICKFVESDIKHRHRLAKHGMVPNHSFLQAITTCLVSTVPEQFYDRVEEGSIILKKAPSFSFCKEGIKVEGDDQPPVKTDVVILATGFKGEQKLQEIFGSKSFREIIVGSQNAVVPLYRGCIPPRIPQLAVMGYLESFNNVFTAEMGSRWLTELLDGKFKLPAIKEMEDDAGKWDVYSKEYGGKFRKRSSVGAIHIWHNDQLCKDMGWKPKERAGFGLNCLSRTAQWTMATKNRSSGVELFKQISQRT